MVVFEVCNPDERKCQSPEVIKNVLKGSYMLLTDNSQNYIHYEKPGSEGMIRGFSYQKWYAFSTIVRLDNPRKVMITDIIWD